VGCGRRGSAAPPPGCSGSSERGSASPARDEGNGSARETVSFEDSFDAEVREEFGDLGPAEQSGGGGDRNSGGRRGGGRRSNRR